MSVFTRQIFTLALVLTSLFVSPLRAQDAAHHHPDAHAGHDTHGEEEAFDTGKLIMHHIGDSHEWEFSKGVSIPLPVILYSPDRGVEVFSSSRFHNDEHEYNGYRLVHGDKEEILPVDEGRTVYDFSITKNVASMILGAIILILVFTSVAKAYNRGKGKAPKGLQSAMEVLVLFIRDEVVKPNIGPHYGKYLPYLLTLFFFILINNLLGLVPGGANVTGNIAITLVLALLTFIITHANSNKYYWKHLVAPTGVPAALLPIMIPVEIVGVFMKPFSLMLRLFANITAGHIILLALFSLIFIFKSFVLAPVVSVFILFMNFIEILVAFLQAFIFTLLSSMYIGSAIEEHSHADHGH